jgi:hypothetical protein
MGENHLKNTYMGYQWEHREESDEKPVHDYDSEVTVPDAMSRFDFETQFMDCWNITSDLQSILDADGATREDVADMLRGLIKLYGYKFARANDTFEEILKNGELYG